MKCGKNGIDTHPDVIRCACGIWYYPNETGSSRPCKFYARCQNMIRDGITNIPWVMDKHKEYLESEAVKP